MKYLGSFSITESTLILNIPNNYFPKRWTIVDYDKIKTPIYHIETITGQAPSSRWYSCSIYQDGEYVDIINRGALDGE